MCCITLTENAASMKRWHRFHDLSTNLLLYIKESLQIWTEIKYYLDILHSNRLQFKLKTVSAFIVKLFIRFWHLKKREDEMKKNPIRKQKVNHFLNIIIMRFQNNVTTWKWQKHPFCNTTIQHVTRQLAITVFNLITTNKLKSA